MALLNSKLRKRFAKVGKQESNPRVIAKFFDPCGSATWFITEYNPQDRIFYCYVTGLTENEWGYTSLDELESYQGREPFNIPIERDRHFQEKRFSDLGLE